HLVLRQGAIQLVIGDVAALLGAGDQLLDRRLVEIEQRRVAAFVRMCLALIALARHESPYSAPEPPNSPANCSVQSWGWANSATRDARSAFNFRNDCCRA